MELDAYNVNWPGLGNRYHKVVGCGEGPKRAVCSLHKCMNGGALLGYGERGGDQVEGEDHRVQSGK